jgi:hypothetical protein
MKLLTHKVSDKRRASGEEVNEIKSCSAGFSLIRYHMYLTGPSFPPKYFFSGIISTSSQPSGKISSTPLGSPVSERHGN